MRKKDLIQYRAEAEQLVAERNQTIKTLEQQRDDLINQIGMLKEILKVIGINVLHVVADNIVVEKFTDENKITQVNISPIDPDLIVTAGFGEKL